MKPRLVAVSGPLAGRSFELVAAPLTLGRHAESSVRIEDIAVSRHHCVLELRDGEVLLQDLNSRHGTFVNGFHETWPIVCRCQPAVAASR